MRKKCSSDQEKLLRSLEEFIQTVKGQNKFGNRMLLACSWMFLTLNKLGRTIIIKIGKKNVGI